MIPQSTFMIVAEINPQQLESLRSLLASMNRDQGRVNPANRLVPFNQFKQLHMARFVIIEAQTADDITVYGKVPRPWPATLMFLGDCDGPHDLFLAELAVRAGPGLKEIFSHCKYFDADKDILLQWMLQRNKTPAANYINWLGRTVNQVHEEARLHEVLKTKLDATLDQNHSLNPREIHRTLVEFVRQQIKMKRLILSPIPRTPFGWWLKNLIHKLGVPLLLLVVSPLLLILVPFVVIRLRWLERTDPEITPRPESAKADELAVLEDHLVTNQFSAFGDVKPGPVRRYLIIFFLCILNYTARHIYNRGYLTRVQTIHFARWVLLDDNNRVLFASNYDGDLESYMDDFINKVGWGLNLVFSNGVGYPRTHWLIKQGSKQEQKFKYFLRRHQYPTQVWYKAYPDLTALDCARNTKIRLGLEKQFRTERDCIDWIRLI